MGANYISLGLYKQARSLFEQALPEIFPTQDTRGQVSFLEFLGRVLLAMGDVPGAARRFSEARELASSQGFAARVCESTADLAACAIMQGQLDEARNCVHGAWNHLKEYGWMGMGYPGNVYRTCAETFDALGSMVSFCAILESGHQTLMEVADTINVPAWRQSFLENVPEHRAIMEMWERSKL